ncbi:unnamed protein product [Cuscuta campestris]|uniref:Uncharacterized protein n=1 Tax=Cuscuta campestris TaxID=132261 RepID=A0A484LS82_9ASTE|nr:unnamed protein product [Cuscuta campestris]VFQ78668.1 unnamed protein product [Cuscuta campestris]
MPDPMLIIRYIVVALTEYSKQKAQYDTGGRWGEIVGMDVTSFETIYGDKEVKISQKKLRTKLHLPKSGIGIGKLSPKALNWSKIGISGKASTGPAKKGDLKSDYKLLLELKFLCQGLYIGYVLECLKVATDGKKYEERYWLYFLGNKDESKASSAAEEEGSSNEVLATTLKKASKRKQVASSSQNADEPQSLELVVLDQEEASDQRELQKKKKKKKITTSSESGNANLENSQQNQLHDTFQVHEETHEKIQSHGSPSPCWSCALMAKCSSLSYHEAELETQGNADEHQEHEVQKYVEETLMSTLSETEVETEVETEQIPEMEAQRSPTEKGEDVEVANLEVSIETLVTINEKHIEEVVRDPLSQDISNYRDEEVEEESVKTLKIGEEDAENEEEAKSLPLQCFHNLPPTNQVTHFNLHNSTFRPILPDEMPELWAKKVEGLIDSALESQRASFQEVLEKTEERHNLMMESTEERHNSGLQEISNSLNKTLEIISQMSSSMSTIMMTYASDSHLQLKEVVEIKHHLAAITRSLRKQT